jgi:hypothetical protein
MSSENAKKCCDEYRCRRSKPLLVRKGGFSGRWFVITDYKPRGENGIEAMQKHDVTDELIAQLLADGWTPPREVEHV